MTRFKQLKRHAYGDVLVAEKVLTSAQVLLLNTTPQVLVNAPGNGNMLYFIDGMIQLGTGTTDYATDGDLTINYKTAGTGAAVTSSLDDVINDGTARSVSFFGGLQENENIAIADIENQPLALISTVNPTTGDYPLIVRIRYMIVPC
jgi:hypothetical protein